MKVAFVVLLFAVTALAMPGVEANPNACPTGELCTNRDPFADAGNDITIPEYTSIRLSGAESYDLDPDSDLSYSWRIDSMSPAIKAPVKYVNATMKCYYAYGLTYLEPDAGGCGVEKLPEPILVDADTVSPCLIAPYLPPDFGPVLRVTLNLTVIDGLDSPPLKSDPNPWSEYDEVTVTISNTNQVPHGPGAPTAPTCDDPALLPEFLASTALEQPKVIDPVTKGATVTATDEFDILANADDNMLIRIAKPNPIMDDVGVASVEAVLTRVGSGGNPDLATTIRVPLQMQSEEAYTDPGSVPAWGREIDGKPVWPRQAVSTWLGRLPITTPELISGITGSGVTYNVLVTAYDRQGGHISNTEQELQVAITCAQCPTLEHELRLVDGVDADPPKPVECFRNIAGKPPTGAPQSILYDPIGVGPGQIARFNITSFLKDVTPRVNIVPENLMVREVTYRICIGGLGQPSISPQALLEYPYFLDLDTLPDGPLEIWVHALFRDGTFKDAVVRITSDSFAPNMHVSFPDPVFTDVPFYVRVYLRDQLGSSVSLETPRIDYGAGSIARVNTTGPPTEGALPSLALPDLSRAFRFDIPSYDPKATVPLPNYDGLRDFVIDDNGDGTPDSYFDIATGALRKFIKADCNGDKVTDLSVDWNADAKGCGPADAILYMTSCLQGDRPAGLLDWNDSGVCDPAATPKEFALHMEYSGITLTAFAGTHDGPEDLEAFLAQAGPLVLVTFVPTPHFIGEDSWKIVAKDSVGNTALLQGTYHVVIITGDLALVKLEVAGREPRFGAFNETGAYEDGEEFLASTIVKGKNVPPPLLSGDEVRFKAKVLYKSGAAPLLAQAVIDGETGTDCESHSNPSKLLDPGKDVERCASEILGPGRHTITAKARIVGKTVNETDTTNQEASTEVEVFLGRVDFTALGGQKLTFHVRANDNGQPLLKGGAIDLDSGKTYDLRLNDQLDKYLFNITVKGTGKGATSHTVIVTWDPLEQRDVGDEKLTPCKDVDHPKACRNITVFAESKPAKVESKDSPGVGSVLLLGLLAMLGIALRRRQA